MQLNNVLQKLTLMVGHIAWASACGALPGARKEQPLALSASVLGFLCYSLQRDCSHSMFGSLNNALTSCLICWDVLHSWLHVCR